MYYQLIQQFVKTLTNLDAIIDKAVKDAEVRKYEPNNLVTERLIVDMFPLSRQIQIACDVAKTAAATAAGKEPPKHEDNEKTLPDLKGRIHKCVDYLQSFKESDFADINPKRKIKLTFPPNKLMYVEDAMISRAIPNFFFHVTMAYALIRRGAVPVGKADYLGNLNLLDS